MVHQLGAVVDFVGGRGFRLGQLTGDVLRRHGDAEVGVGLRPGGGVAPVVAIVEGEDHRKEGVVLLFTAQHLLGVGIEGEAGLAHIEASGGHHALDGVAPVSHGGLQYILHRAGVGFVVFVHQAGGDVVAVELGGIGGGHIHHVGGLGYLHLVALCLHRLAPWVELLEEATHHLEVDAGRLFAAVGRDEHRGVGFAVGQEEVDHQGGKEGGLAVLSRDAHIRLVVASLAGAAPIPANEVGHDEELPRLQHEGLAGCQPAEVLQHADEAHTVCHAVEAELQPLIVEVVEVSLAGLLHEAACHHLAADDLGGIAVEAGLRYLLVIAHRGRRGLTGWAG